MLLLPDADEPVAVSAAQRQWWRGTARSWSRLARPSTRRPLATSATRLAVAVGGLAAAAVVVDVLVAAAAVAMGAAERTKAADVANTELRRRLPALP
jgi:negative regulator of sigma E activity